MPEAQKIAAATTGAELFGEDRAVVVVRVTLPGSAPELWDLDRALPVGAEVEPVLISEPDGLDVLRHSAAHVLAQAVQQTFPDAKLGIGPPIRDGFYYEFDCDPFTPEDLSRLDKTMARIIKEGQTFRRRVVTEDEARQELASEPYKLELIGLKGSADTAGEGANVEVGGAELTIYDNVRGAGRVDADGQPKETVAWKDLCRGPHLPNTRLIGQGVKLTRSSAAYWRGDQTGPSLQRVYGTAWPSKEELRAYQERLAEAERRDHRRLGTEMELFSFHEQVGSGLPLIHPNGGVIKRVMEDYVR
ncbi:MAG: threonine--tRNA ligase, partial [Promicromonosporaceae bacterium]|nr:threonine--tRNA ligase [Promicromonosporaceae bacterium]